MSVRGEKKNYALLVLMQHGRGCCFACLEGPSVTGVRGYIRAFRLNEDLSRGSHQVWMGSCEEKAAELSVGSLDDAYIWGHVP